MSNITSFSQSSIADDGAEDGICVFVGIVDGDLFWTVIGVCND